jgi:hypothetical protein
VVALDGDGALHPDQRRGENEREGQAFEHAVGEPAREQRVDVLAVHPDDDDQRDLHQPEETAADPAIEAE